MRRRKAGGVAMLRKLDIDDNQQRWFPAFDAFIKGNATACPVCGKIGLESTAGCGKDRVGFLVITCSSCGKSGYMSRITFPENLEIQLFEQDE